MSSGKECHIFEPQPGRWFYALETDNYGGSWRYNAICYGPFRSSEEAYQHLDRHHSNPGGYCEIPHAEFENDATYERLIANAEKPRA